MPRFIGTLLATMLLPTAFAVPHDLQLSFKTEPDPARFRVASGAIRCEEGKLLLDAAVLDLRYYPLREGKSRPAFGNFEMQLTVEGGTRYRWGLHRDMRDTVELEVDGRRARLIASENGKRTLSGPWQNLPPAKEGADSFTLQRFGKQLTFLSGTTVLAAWQGELPAIFDFSIQAPEGKLAVSAWRFRPLPRFAGYTELQRRSGQTLEGFDPNLGGGLDEGYVWSTGKPAEMQLTVGNPTRETRNYVLQIDVTDLDDQPVRHTERKLVRAAGEEKMEAIELPSDRNGYFNLRTRLFDDAGNPLEASNAVGFAITAAKLATELSREAVMGIHGLPFARHGAKHVRYWDNGGRKMFWSGIEAQPGQWDFSLIDAYVNKTLAAGMTPLVVLAATPEWASTEPERGTYIGKGAYGPPKKLEEWRQYCRRLAQHLKGRVSHYEIWNEPNNNKLAPTGFFFHGDVAAYLELVRAAYREVKAVDPGAQILAPSGTGNFFPFLDKFMELGGGDSFDILSIHTYCTPLPPEIGYHFNNEKDYLSRVERSREIMKKYGHAKPIWNTEIGYHSGLNLRIGGTLITADRIAAEALPEAWPNWKSKWSFRPLDPRRAAAFFTRFGLLSMVYGVERVYVHHRMLEHERDPYTPLAAVGFLNTLFDGAQFVRRLETADPNVHLYEFRLAGNRTAVAAWQVYPETLMMSQKGDRELKGVDSAPLENLDGQKALTSKAAVRRSHYFLPGSRHYFRLSPSSRPARILDLWGNEVGPERLEKLDEMPLYLVYDSPAPQLSMTVRQGGAIPEKVAEPEPFRGKAVEAVPVASPRTPEEVLGKTVSLRLREAELIDGAAWNKKGWLELHKNQGIAFGPGRNFPQRGRFLLELRSGSNLNAFSFRYELKRNGELVRTQEWPVFPRREIMQGKGWVLAAGYLISDPVDFTPDARFTLHAAQGNSQILKISVIPE